MSKLLLVEDDASFAHNLIIVLKSSRFTVDHATSAEGALEFLATYVYDAAIFDWELPGLSGPELCKRSKQRYPNLPVIMLTSRSGPNNTIVGLDSGADDYLPKPCSTDELLARLRALLRRPVEEELDVLVCGQLRIIQSKHLAQLCGQALDLSPREFELLQFFMNHPDKHFNSEALFSRIWTNRQDVSPELVRMYVKKLRDKLQAFTGTSPIETVTGKGYVLSLSVSGSLTLKSES